MQDWIKDKLVTNWKTTLLGFTGFLISSIVQNPDQFPPVIVSVSQIILSTGVLTVGVVANDKFLK